MSDGAWLTALLLGAVLFAGCLVALFLRGATPRKYEPDEHRDGEGV